MNKPAIKAAAIAARESQLRFLSEAAKTERGTVAHSICIQCAWNDRQRMNALRAEYNMSAAELQDRETTNAIKRLSAEIVFWRDSLHCSTVELIARIRRWENAGDMAYSRTTRGVAVAVMLDLYA